MADYEVLAPGGHENLINNVTERLDEKAYIDGYYAQLTAGAADSLTGRGDGVSASYLYRTTGGDADVADGTATVKSIHGRTVRWNQLVGTMTASTSSHGVTAARNNDGSATLSGTSDASSTITLMGDIPIIANHRYLVSGGIAGGSKNTYYLNVSGLGKDYGNGDIFTYGSDIAGNLRYSFSAGVTFDNATCWPQLFDLTAMFGAGNEPSTVAEFEAMYPDPYYPYDAGSLLSVQMEGIETVGFNQWDEEWEVGGFNNETGQKNPYVAPRTTSTCFRTQPTITTSA